MQLRNPGPVQTAPALEGHAGQLAEIIARWPGVSAYTHWRLGLPDVVDGAEFHLGDPELGHIHLDGMAHIPLNATLTSLLVRKGLGRTPGWSSAWITHPVRSPADVRDASFLFRLARSRLCGGSDAELVERIEHEAHLPAG